jgi:lipid-A-disaccharide synthase
MRQTARAVVQGRPDVLVIIDSPDFTHRVARMVRRAAPDIPVIDYVSPTVWAWRPGRARAMTAYVDRVLALLPFEPDAYVRLAGPPCTFVGHPLAVSVGRLRPDSSEAARREAAPPRLLMLPGSRRSEVRHLIPPFAAAIAKVGAQLGPMELLLPTVPHLADLVRGLVAQHGLAARVITDPQEKYAAFRTARAALASSGTVTLELGLAGVPTVAAYRIPAIEAAVYRRLITATTVILTNLVLGENVVPEFLQENCTPDRLAAALVPLLGDTPERQAHSAALKRLDAVMELGVADPSERAADIVMRAARGGRAGVA